MTKAQWKTEYPIIDLDDEVDERHPDVYLLDCYEEVKTTAQEFADYWMIRDWELTPVGEQLYWFVRSGYSIDKDTVAKLNEFGGRK